MQESAAQWRVPAKQKVTLLPHVTGREIWSFASAVALCTRVLGSEVIAAQQQAWSDTRALSADRRPKAPPTTDRRQRRRWPLRADLRGHTACLAGRRLHLGAVEPTLADDAELRRVAEWTPRPAIRGALLHGTNDIEGTAARARQLGACRVDDAHCLTLRSQAGRCSDRSGLQPEA